MDTDALATLIGELSSLPGPSGFEEAVVEDMQRRWGLTARRDAVGNLLLRLGGEGPRTLVEAHADQVGFVVRSIDARGFLHLDTAQGPRDTGPELRWPVGQGARVMTRRGGVVEGVFAAASGHVEPNSTDAGPHLTWQDFWVDLGLEDRVAVLDLGVHVGAAVLPEARLRRLGSYRLAGCAMDDRVGLATLEALRATVTDATLDCELWLGVTVQEESGRHGATVLARGETFDRVFGIEVGLVGDIPNLNAMDHPACLGAGPIIVHKDELMHYDRHLTNLLHEAAAAHGIPVQEAVFSNYGSDGTGFLGAGFPTALLAIPTRYTHTAFEMLDLRDVTATVQLLVNALTKPPRHRPGKTAAGEHAASKPSTAHSDR